MSDQSTIETAGTLWDTFLDRVRRTPDSTAYREYDGRLHRWRDYSWMEMSARVARMQAGLARAGLQIGDRVGVLLPNGTDWVSFDLAAHSLGLVVVGLYPHETAATNAYILEHSDVGLALLDSSARLTAIASSGRELARLQHVWFRDEPTADYSSHHCQQNSLAEVLAGPDASISEIRIKPHDIATLIYTSGTTGRPKGVILSHFDLCWNAKAAGLIVPPRCDDVFLSVLPLAHAFERTVGYYLPMLTGCTVAYARSPQTLAEDFLSIRPSAILGVPLLFERVAAAIQAKVGDKWVRRKLLNAAIGTGWSHFLSEQRRTKPNVAKVLLWRILDRLVSKPIRAGFGGRLRVAISGGAPLLPGVSRTLIGLGLPIVEGYGLTEAGPVVSANGLDDNWPGSVGRPLPGVEVKLGAQSELLVRSPAVMVGYWKDPLLTKQVLDSEGWLSTGDVAELTVSNRIFLHGRLADQIVLSIGEKIDPAVVEAQICLDPVFEHAAVFGHRRPYLAVLAVLNPRGWRIFAAERGLDPTDPNNPAGKIALLFRIATTVADLPYYAQPRVCHFTLSPWTIERGLLTPSLKIKRDAIAAIFAKQIDDLYDSSMASTHSPVGSAAESERAPGSH